MGNKIKKHLISNLQNQLLKMFSLLTMVILSGCATQLPSTTESTRQDSQIYTDSYDRVWGIVTSAIQNEGFDLGVLEKDSGVINGIKNLEPSTMDMLMNYSVRIRVSVMVQRIDDNYVEVSIDSNEERKYEERGWRPARDADSYSKALFDAIGQRLTLRTSDDVARRNSEKANAEAQASNAASTQNLSTTPQREKVQKAQSLLNDLGYTPGPADGIMGARTAAALRSFQSDHGLTVTGMVDQQTWEALNNTTPSQQQSNKNADQPVEDGSTSSQSNQNSSWGKAIAVTELKSMADPFADTVEVIVAGGRVEILRAEGEWLFVRYNGHSGFVYSEFINQ